MTELEASGATVRATPVVEQRGTLANLLFSFAPILLLIVFYSWVFRRQRALGRGLFGTGGKKKPVDPETVRVSFDDVAGIDEVKAEISEVVDYLKDPEKYRRVGARAPKGVLLSGAPRSRHQGRADGGVGRQPRSGMLLHAEPGRDCRSKRYVGRGPYAHARRAR